MSSETEHLSSVHDNPFIRQFGLPHHNTSGENPSVARSICSDRDDDEPQQEYHVNSGFVNKLRSKFSQLENKSQRTGLSRRSASVENLLSVGTGDSSSGIKYGSRFGNAGKTSRDDTVTTSRDAVHLRHLVPKGYQPKIRPHSNDLEKSTERSGFSNKKDVESLKQSFAAVKNVKPPLPRKAPGISATQKKYNRSSSNDSVLKSKPEHHDWKVAPDVEKYGRDDIVIIENEPKDDNKPNQNNERRSSSSANRSSEPDGIVVQPVTDKDRITDENELPKPNTVSAFRNLFEKTSKTVETLNVWRQSSPTRKFSGSDNNSPTVISPATTPRSPLVNVNNDNVFDNSKTVNSSEVIKPVSPRESVNDTTQNVDTSSVSIQKSRDVFNRRGSVDLLQEKERFGGYRASSPDRSASSSVQHTLTPIHPVSKVFDSKSLSKPTRTDKPKRPKPSIPRKDHIPKDTIELKHEHDKLEAEKKAAEQRRQQRKEAEERRLSGSDIKITNIEKRKPAAFSFEKETKDIEPEQSEVMSPKPENANLSPRQTNIFDSSQIVKKNKERPKTPTSPTEEPNYNNVTVISVNVPSSSTLEARPLSPVTNNVSSVSRESPSRNNNDNGFEAMDISPAKPTRNSYDSTLPSSNSGYTDITPTIVASEKSSVSRRIIEPKFPRPEVTESKPEPVKQRVKTADNKDAPMTGMSSFLAARLKKDAKEQENGFASTSNNLANGASPSPVPRKRQAPEVPVVNGSGSPSDDVPPPLPASVEPSAPSSTFDDLIKRKGNKKKQQTATKMVFDSSKIATKRKEPPKRKPPRKTLDEMNQEVKEKVSPVPKIDLSFTNNDDTPYQEGYIPTEIKPCPFIFIGAEVKVGKNPLKKTRKAKVRFVVQLDI